jgi:hypoxanthine phosphoribosyltransferase
MNTDIQRVLIDQVSIAAKVGELAAQIATAYRDVDELIMVCILNGAFRFTADLEAHLSVPYNIDFMSLSSYPSASTKATGEVRVLLDVKNSLHGKHVLIVEDIIDTGHTMHYILQVLQARGPASVKICSLLNKAQRREVEVPLDYVGFDIPNKFVFGYGLDLDEYFRSLPFVGVVKPGLFLPQQD